MGISPVRWLWCVQLKFSANRRIRFQEWSKKIGYGSHFQKKSDNHRLRSLLLYMVHKFISNWPFLSKKDLQHLNRWIILVIKISRGLIFFSWGSCSAIGHRHGQIPLWTGYWRGSETFCRAFWVLLSSGYALCITKNSKTPRLVLRCQIRCFRFTVWVVLTCSLVCLHRLTGVSPVPPRRWKLKPTVKIQADHPFLLGKSKLVVVSRLDYHTYVHDVLAVKITLKLKYHIPTMCTGRHLYVVIAAPLNWVYRNQDQEYEYMQHQIDQYIHEYVYHCI